MDSRWVVGNALAGLWADGTFDYQGIQPEFSEEISKSQAEEIGLVFARTVPNRGDAVLDYVEEGHGGPVDFSTLELCQRTFFMRSPFEPAPDAVPGAQRNVAGGDWIMILCDRKNVPTAVQMVAARTRGTVSNGRINFPVNSGNDFFIAGYPLVSTVPVFQSPELAARLVYLRTHTRISEVPSILEDIYTIGPSLGAFWIVTTESPVRVRRQNTVIETSRFYVLFGFAALPGNEVYVDGDEPLKPFWARYPVSGSQRDDSVLITPRFPLDIVPFELAP